MASLGSATPSAASFRGSCGGGWSGMFRDQETEIRKMRNRGVVSVQRAIRELALYHDRIRGMNLPSERHSNDAQFVLVTCWRSWPRSLAGLRFD